jgi:ABC-type lipoprotein release transport system permease subunit
MTRMGFRNLWRNKRRTLLTMSAMALATALLIVTLGITEAVLVDSVRNATGLYHGHAKIAAPGYLDARDMALTLDATAPDVASDRRVQGMAGRVRGFALLSSGEETHALSQPAELLGVDSAEEEPVSQLSTRVVAGSNLDPARPDGILLGTTLAKRLGVGLGSEVVAMGQASDGSVAAEIFQVSGLLDSGDAMLNGSLALADRRKVQAMFALDAQVHEWVVALKDPKASRAWAAELQARLPEAEVAPWERMLPQIASMIQQSGTSKLLTSVIFYFAVVLVTVNTMYMAQLERLREFAVMGAIGLKPRRLMGLMVIEGSFMSAIAAVVGGLAGMALSLYLADHPIVMSSSTETLSMAGTTLSTSMRSVLTWDSVLFPVLLMMSLGGVLSLFPAWKLGRLRPVDALREV